MFYQLFLRSISRQNDDVATKSSNLIVARSPQTPAVFLLDCANIDSVIMEKLHFFPFLRSELEHKKEMFNRVLDSPVLIKRSQYQFCRKSNSDKSDINK